MAASQQQIYTEKIRGKLRARRLAPMHLEGNDAGFVHDGRIYFIEIKSRNALDFGQRALTWSREKGGWEWAETDWVTRLYDGYGVKEHIEPDFVPRRYAVEPPGKISAADEQFDRKGFEKARIPLRDIAVLYEFFARRRCFYIQIEGKGLFYLTNDLARLGVPMFSPPLSMRLFVKKQPGRAHEFFAVIEADINILSRSPFDLEETTGIFPTI